MPFEIDRPVAGDEVILLERTTPQRYREWLIALTGGIEAVPAEIRDRIPAPEEELKTLLARMLPGDELWLARSRRFEPTALIGNSGIAVVRNGDAIWYRVGVHH
ncbi:hypothetical protein HJA76_01320 [Rhizobium bangladeshense]|uniref:hypothetical protein n=1 Tax=Rhizobium bangladeshense TaxID=1138189 RepID=UPI001C8366BA|nr:hypothetical protein [Rhizobium bangladeshense]MBX4918370.1 hypothetical protein [Rhizobium bangladeshense]